LGRNKIKLPESVNYFRDSHRIKRLEEKGFLSIQKWVERRGATSRRPVAGESAFLHFSL